jgi:hypothetical protein
MPRDVQEGASSPTTDEESHGRRTEERETRLAKRHCLAAPSISPSPSISPPPAGKNCPLTVISGDRQTFYVDRPMICAASTFIRNTLADTLCEVLNLPPWLRATSLRYALQHTRRRQSSRSNTPAEQEAASYWERDFVGRLLAAERDQRALLALLRASSYLEMEDLVSLLCRHLCANTFHTLTHPHTLTHTLPHPHTLSHPHTPSHTLTHPHTPSHTLTHPHTPSHTLTHPTPDNAPITPQDPLTRL